MISNLQKLFLGWVWVLVSHSPGSQLPSHGSLEEHGTGQKVGGTTVT